MIILQNIIESNYRFQPAWIMVLIVISIMIIGYLFSAFHSRFVSMLRAFFLIRFSNQLSREEYSLTHPVSAFLSLNFIISCSLFIYQSISSKSVFYLTYESNFSSFLIVVFCVTIIYLVKTVSIKILGFVLEKQLVANEYIFILFLVNQITGIGLIPIIIFIAYGKKSIESGFIYIGIAFLIFAFIVRIGKGIVSSLSSRQVTPFYIILYLCTFEILPLLLGFKLLERLN